MVDNVIVSNAPQSVNADIPVRTSVTASNQQIQHMRLDIGVGTAEDVVTSSNGLPVVVTSMPTRAAATLTNVSASATSVQLLASNSSRTQAVFYNDTDKNAYVKLGTTASTSSFSYLLLPGATLELPKPIYTGQIDCIWAAGPTGSMRITEI